MGNRIQVLLENKVLNPILTPFESLLHVKIKMPVLPHAADCEIGYYRFFLTWNPKSAVPFEIFSRDLRPFDLSPLVILSSSPVKISRITIPMPRGHDAHKHEK